MQEMTLEMIQIIGNGIFYGSHSDNIIETYKLNNEEFYYWDSMLENWNDLSKPYLLTNEIKLFILNEDI